MLDRLGSPDIIDKLLSPAKWNLSSLKWDSRLRLETGMHADLHIGSQRKGIKPPVLLTNTLSLYYRPLVPAAVSVQEEHPINLYTLAPESSWCRSEQTAPLGLDLGNLGKPGDRPNVHLQ